MSNIIYHSSRALNENTSGFIEFDTIDFSIEDVGRKLMKNSVYIEADVEVFKSTGAAVVLKDKVGINKNIGYNSVFESFSVDAAGRTIQNLQHYGRYCNIVNVCSGNIGTVFSPSSQAESLQVTEEAGRYAVQAVNGSHQSASNAVVSRSQQFCIKPKICLNSMFGDDYSFEKRGPIRISTNLARNGAVLYGPDVSATSSYTLKNVRLRYITVKDDGKSGEILMNSVIGIKQSIHSQQANLSVRVPAQSVTGVVMTYISQANEIALLNDSFKLEYLPGLDELVYLFSDSQSKYISYNITDMDDMSALGIAALSNSGVKCKVNSFQNAGGENVIHGLDFQSSVDLRNQKFAVNLRSVNDSLAADPRNVYLHFLNMINL